MDTKTFRGQSSFNTRADDLLKNKLCKKNIPCVMFRGPTSSTIPSLEKCQVMLPKTITFGVAMNAIKNRLMHTLDPSTVLFYHIQVYEKDEHNPKIRGVIVPSDDLCINVYENYKSDDGLLYITYSCESVLG